MPARDLKGDILRLLVPLIGESMARGSIKAHCARYGFDPDHLQPADMQVLAKVIGQGLVCFVGKGRSAQVAAAIEGLGRS